MGIIPFKATTRAQRRAIIDEFGGLQHEVEAFKPTRERYEALSKEIRGWYEKESGEQPYLEEGARYVLQVSAATNERTITSMPKLFRILGIDAFLRFCRFPLAVVDVEVPAPRHKDFIAEAMTGPRKLKAVAKESRPAMREAA
jgi:hypothetical protein